jgi:hypothetical protein
VDHARFELATSCMPCKRATSCANGPGGRVFREFTALRLPLIGGRCRHRPHSVDPARFGRALSAMRGQCVTTPPWARAWGCVKPRAPASPAAVSGARAAIGNPHPQLAPGQQWLPPARHCPGSLCVGTPGGGPCVPVCRPGVQAPGKPTPVGYRLGVPLFSWQLTAHRGAASGEGLEPPACGFGDRRSTS